MTALGPRPEPAVTTGQHVAAHRRPDRRTRTLEKALAALMLFLAFAITVVLLGLQWLGDQSTASSAPKPASYSLVSEVQPS
jgi:hypothetical protein